MVVGCDVIGVWQVVLPIVNDCKAPVMHEGTGQGMCMCLYVGGVIFTASRIISVRD